MEGKEYAAGKVLSGCAMCTLCKQSVRASLCVGVGSTRCCMYAVRYVEGFVMIFLWGGDVMGK